jgi:LuxR family maltose regulon positive regulatory protein
MPKLAKNALIWSEKQNGYGFYNEGRREHPLHVLDETGRFDEDWLAGHNAFAFHGKAGQVNVLKEARLHSEEGYWYAYRRQGKRMVKKYLGRSADLTIRRLEDTAKILNGENPVAAGKRAKRNSVELYPAAREENEAIPRPNGVTSTKEIQNTREVNTPPSLLLEPKLRLPRLHSTVIGRERLLARLDKGRERKLTLISAPAGFGKTTLVCQWVANRNASQNLPPVAWLSLDEGDNDPVRFWRYIIAACQTFQPGIGQASLGLLHAASQPPFEAVPLQTVLTTFLNELTQSGQPAILVLEDYHVIEASAIQETVAFFLEHLPPTLNLIFITRHEPPLPLARLRARGELLEVQASDLRFSHEETADFLRRVTGVSLSKETVTRLDSQIEGWAAGLRLLALTLQERMSQREIEQNLESLAGNHRLIQDYFVTEVLATQPEPLQNFLLKTSGLSRLTASLCEALTGTKDSAQLLEFLDRSNLFLEPLDETGEWYRYHALFAEAMQREARRRLGADIHQELLQKASEWYEQHGLLTDAVESASQIQNYPRVIALIEKLVGTEPFLFGVWHFSDVIEFHTLRRWIEDLPREVLKQHPELCLTYATALFMVFIIDQLPHTPTSLRQIEEVLGLAESGWRREGNTARLGGVFAFRSLLARQQGEIREAVTWASQALEWLPEEEVGWRSLSLSVVGTYESLEGNLKIARERLLEARTLYEYAKNPAVTRAHTGMLSWACLEQGELHQAAENFRYMLAEARAQNDLDDIVHSQHALAQISYEWNELEQAGWQIQEAYEVGLRVSNEQLVGQVLIVMARQKYAQGQTEEAQKQLDEFLKRLQPHNSALSYQLYREIQALQTHFRLQAGDLAAVQRWVSSRNLQVSPAFEKSLLWVQRQREALLLARWQLAVGQPHQALKILEPALAVARQMGRVRNTLEIQVLMALAHVASKQTHEARQLLKEIILAAHPEGYLRLFLDEGEAMATLLRSLAPQVREKSLNTYLHKILAAFAQESPTSEVANTSLSKTLLEPLSGQEQRVLRLLVAGLSNPEIAGELVVSVNTIRSQVQSIYRKLEVNNRVAAGEAARRLQLL